MACLVAAPGVPVHGPSGASAHVRGLFRALAARGEARLFAALGVDRRGLHEGGVPAELSGVPGWPSWLERYRDQTEIIAARRVARAVERAAGRGWRPDLIWERHSLFSDAGWRVSDRLGIPWVLEVNAPPVLERGRFEQLRRPVMAARWERSVLQAAPLVVAVSRWLVDWLQTEVGCRRVVWLPNGVEPFVGDRVRGRALLGADADEPLVGFLGSMRPWHGHERLGGIAREIGARPVLIGAMSGPSPEGALSPGFLSGQQLADSVAALDLGLAPYPADAPPWFCPLKILAYRAQGVPVVASDLGDCAVMTGSGGQVVPAGDEAAWVEAARAWIGRPVVPRARSWARVAQELLAAAEGEAWWSAG